MVIPVRYHTPPPAPRPTSTAGSILGSLVRAFVGIVLAISLGLNLIFLFVFLLGGAGEDGGGPLRERMITGESTATQKIAVVRVEGIILEGQLNYVYKQIEAAATDERVKAVVLRVNSPGGSVTASDDLHQAIKLLADGKVYKQRGGPKPIIVSMGAMAASGGYYISMPAQYVLAERTTLTGSIGVIVTLPNLTGLGEKLGISTNVIKSGDIKDSGAMFRSMTAQERHLWQQQVNSSYDIFLKVVEAGRPKLTRGVMVDDKVDVQQIPDVDAAGKPILVDGKPKLVPYSRYRADGGTYTAKEALTLGLIDAIGYQDDAIEKAKELATLEGDVKVVQYERPAGLANLLLGAKSDPIEGKLDLGKFSASATPRLWYLAPQSELAGFLSAAGQK